MCAFVGEGYFKKFLEKKLKHENKSCLLEKKIKKIKIKVAYLTLAQNHK